MTGAPNPYSREGARPGDGLGEANPFETLADGATPRAAANPAPTPAPLPERHAGAVGGFETYSPEAPRSLVQDSVPHSMQPYPMQSHSTQPHSMQPYPMQQPAPMMHPYPPYASMPQPSGLATAALVCGIVSLFVWVIGPVALGLGIGGIKQARRNPRLYSGGGSAIAGLVLGAVSTLIMLLYVAVFLYFVVSLPWRG